MLNSFFFRTLFLGFITAVCSAPELSAEPDSDYYHEGDLAGSLKTEGPLAVYHPDPQHVWNRLFSAFYIRTSNIPAKPDGKPIQRIEGGDYIDFFAWSRTEYWSSAETAKRLNHLLGEFLNAGKTQMVDEPQKRVVLLRDPAKSSDELFGTSGDCSIFSIRETAVRIQIDRVINGSNAAITHGEIASGDMGASKFVR